MMHDTTTQQGAPRVWNYYLDPRTQLCTIYDSAGHAMAHYVTESEAKRVVDRENNRGA